MRGAEEEGVCAADQLGVVRLESRAAPHAGVEWVHGVRDDPSLLDVLRAVAVRLLDVDHQLPVATVGEGSVDADPASCGELDDDHAHRLCRRQSVERISNKWHRTDGQGGRRGHGQEAGPAG